MRPGVQPLGVWLIYCVPWGTAFWGQEILCLTFRNSLFWAVTVIIVSGLPVTKGVTHPGDADSDVDLDMLGFQHSASQLCIQQRQYCQSKPCLQDLEGIKEWWPEQGLFPLQSNTTLGPKLLHPLATRMLGICHEALKGPFSSFLNLKLKKKKNW